MKRTRPERRNKLTIEGNGFTLENLPAPEPFCSNDFLLEKALSMFNARTEVNHHKADMQESETDVLKNATRVSEGLNEYWHKSFEMTPPAISVRNALHKHKLSRKETEVVLALLLYQLGLLPQGTDTCEGLLSFLGFAGRDSLELIRSLSENGKLQTSGLVSSDDPQEDLRSQTLILDPNLVDIVLERPESTRSIWELGNENELYDKLGLLLRYYAKKCEALGDIDRGMYGQTDFYKVKRVICRQEMLLIETLRLHPEWKLSRMLGVRSDFYLRNEDIMLVILAAKENTHLKMDCGLFKGIGLARAVCNKPEEIDSTLKLLASNSQLVAKGLIQPANGAGSHITDNPADLAEAEFELSRKCFEWLGLSKSTKRKESEVVRILTPRISLDRLVLDAQVHAALGMIFSQSVHNDKLMCDWGLSEVFPYGRAVTALFAGPPGTGKTACAEALSKELGRPLFIADYSRIQNCWVGATEKNIVKVFAEARENGAVLFWDEADAMFFDRDSANRNWEVRDINVLLQEIESFEGVCILATNRKVVLDKALERRISLKVEFSLPDREQRLEIWRRLIPARMPLDPDVNLEALAGHPLSGGQIKNLVLNAARLAVDQGNCVSIEHFNRALDMERSGSWTTRSGQEIGFRFFPVDCDIHGQRR